MKATIITKDAEKFIINYYKQHTARETAKYFHIRPSRLNKILEKYQVEKHAVIKTTITEQIKSEIKNCYEFTTDLDICKKYHITKVRLKQLLLELKIQPHSEFENRSIAKTYHIDNTLKQQIIDYYLDNHTKTDTAAHFNYSRALISKIINEANLNRTHKETYQIPAIREKIIKTCQTKYGVNNYTQTMDFHQKVITHYKFKNETFDSSWELALWIYAKDHNIEIIHELIKLCYSANNKQYYYFPDFKFAGQLIEIKGDHMVDKNKQLVDLWHNLGESKLVAKNNCLIKNNIQIWVKKDVQFALDYIIATYGKDYLKNFRSKKRTKGDEK